MAVSHPAGSGWLQRHLLHAGETLGLAASEALALAMAKAQRRDCAVIPAEGLYFIYAVRGGGKLDLEPAYSQRAGLRLEAGVLALVHAGGTVYRGQDLAHAREGATPEPGATDPFSAVRELHRAAGGLDALDERTLLSTFEAAMFDTALSVLARCEELARRKATQLQTPGATTATEHDQLERTARELLVVHEQLEEKERAIRVIQGTPVDPETHDHPPGWFDALPALQREAAQLAQARQRALAGYPMLGRHRSSAALRQLLALPRPARAALLAGEAALVAADIVTTRANVRSGELELWTVPSVVDATIAGLGLGLGSPARARVLAEARTRRRQGALRNLALAVFGLGFGLLGAALSGGASLAFTAGAVGLGAYDAVTSTQEHFVQHAASNTSLDPDGGLLPAAQRQHWGWLAAAWLGVALDFADVLKAAHIAREIGELAQGRRSLRQAAEALAQGDARIFERLRRAAGDAELTDTVSEAMRPGLSARLGAELVLDAQLGREVQVVYDATSALATGRAAVMHVRVGPGAKVGDVLVHAETVAMVNRYQGLCGRARELWDRVRSFAGLGKAGRNPFPVGSRAFESWQELEKLVRTMAWRRAALAERLAGAVPAQARAGLRRELDFLAAEVDRHARVVEALVLSRGTGVIAMSDATREALSTGHHLPDRPGKAAADLSAEELASSAYYFERKQGGGFELREKVARGEARAGGREDPANVFTNHFPEHPVLPPRRVVKIDHLRRMSGKFNYVVTQDRRLVVGKAFPDPGGGHIDLAGGLDVVAAGEVKVLDGKIVYLDNSSGHYRPSGSGAVRAATEAFEQQGFEASGKYVEKRFDSKLGRWVETP